jgi:hypothetical protein
LVADADEHAPAAGSPRTDDRSLAMHPANCESELRLLHAVALTRTPAAPLKFE